MWWAFSSALSLSRDTFAGRIAFTDKLEPRNDKCKGAAGMNCIPRPVGKSWKTVSCKDNVEYFFKCMIEKRTLSDNKKCSKITSRSTTITAKVICDCRALRTRGEKNSTPHSISQAHLSAEKNVDHKLRSTVRARSMAQIKKKTRRTEGAIFLCGHKLVRSNQRCHLIFFLMSLLLLGKKRPRDDKK